MKKSTTPNYPWIGFGLNDLAYQSAMLALESQQVIALRLAKFALGGPDVARETKLMVSEKIEALSQGSQMLMMGALRGKTDLGATGVMNMYRKKVTANRKRLAG